MFNVVRLDLPLDASEFDTLPERDQNIRLDVCPRSGDDALTWRALGAAHVYHASSAKDELPAQWHVNRALIERTPNLVAVSMYGAGFDTIDVDACSKAGICVMNQSGGNAAAVAEHTFGFMLGLGKRIAESDRRMRRGEQFDRGDLMGIDLAGLTLGLVGIGNVGRRVASLAHAFGMSVIATDPYVSEDEIRARGAEPVSLPALLARADVVSIHCPLDASTRGMIGAREFGAMKRGALFITTARGHIHDEEALHASLVTGHLRGAGLDVWSVEPPPASHPLMKLDNVIVTHHTAGVTHGARREMARRAAAQILDLAHGKRPVRMVNPAAWPAFKSRYERIVDRPLE